MSFQAMAWAVGLKLPTREKFVLLMLANYASNDKGDCYPSLSRLAEDTGMVNNTVISAIQKLESLGVLTVERRQMGGVNLPNIYRLNLAWGGSAPDALPVHLVRGGSAPNAHTYGDRVDVKREIDKANTWLKMNPARRPKRDFGRFLNGWISRAAERCVDDRRTPTKTDRREAFMEGLFGPAGGSRVVDVDATIVG